MRGPVFIEPGNFPLGRKSCHVGIELSHRGAQPERHRRRRCLKKAQADASRRLRAFSVGEEDLQRAVLANLVYTGLGPQAALSGVQPPTERHAFTTTLAHPADRSTARHWPWGRRRYQVLVSDLAASGPRASTSDSNPMIPQRASTATRIVLICCGPRRRLCRPFAERARNGSAAPAPFIKAASNLSQSKRTITWRRSCDMWNATRCVRISLRAPRTGVGRACRSGPRPSVARPPTQRPSPCRRTGHPL